ncbi:hypothetical protein BV20DRAFT_968350 [Pilatotrama ljubarskyi]|nr:hypothetical protein BV20DRAFT_968350 [Pilatotrama ljubarskyi]
MLSKSLVAVALLFLSVSLQAHAQAAVFPALGVEGTPTSSDVQRPSKHSECGNVIVLHNLDLSQPVKADKSGKFSAKVINFVAGKDGSRELTAQVDPTGTGKSFVPAEILKNGDKNPASTGTQDIVAQLPEGVSCSGGASGNSCLVSFTTTGGFGTCVVVQQGAARSSKAASATSTPAAASKTKASGTKHTKVATKATATAKAKTKAKATKAKFLRAASASVAPASGESQEPEQKFAQQQVQVKGSQKRRSVRYARDA